MSVVCSDHFIDLDVDIISGRYNLDSSKAERFSFHSHLSVPSVLFNLANLRIYGISYSVYTRG